MHFYHNQVFGRSIGQISNLWHFNDAENILLHRTCFDATQFYPGTGCETIGGVFDFPAEDAFPCVDREGVRTAGGSFGTQTHGFDKRLKTHFHLDAPIARCKHPRRNALANPQIGLRCILLFRIKVIFFHAQRRIRTQETIWYPTQVHGRLDRSDLFAKYAFIRYVEMVPG